MFSQVVRWLQDIEGHARGLPAPPIDLFDNAARVVGAPMIRDGDGRTSRRQKLRCNLPQPPRAPDDQRPLASKLSHPDLSAQLLDARLGAGRWTDESLEYSGHARPPDFDRNQ